MARDDEQELKKQYEYVAKAARGARTPAPADTTLGQEGVPRQPSARETLLQQLRWEESRVFRNLLELREAIDGVNFAPDHSCEVALKLLNTGRFFRS